MVYRGFKIILISTLIVVHNFGHAFYDTCMILMDIEVESCVRGHHVYSTIWTPVLAELLSCRRELDNSEDRYAVAICNVEDTSSVTFQGKYHFFVQYSLEEAA